MLACESWTVLEKWRLTVISYTGICFSHNQTYPGHNLPQHKWRIIAISVKPQKHCRFLLLKVYFYNYHFYCEISRKMHLTSCLSILVFLDNCMWMHACVRLNIYVTHTSELRAAWPSWCCCHADIEPIESPGEPKPCRDESSALLREYSNAKQHNNNHQHCLWIIQTHFYSSVVYSLWV